ncbi:MAG TPA: hypothetical protein ENI87_00435, partial [bacterium]|nr:hypothetical protein [bacterium]
MRSSISRGLGWRAAPSLPPTKRTAAARPHGRGQETPFGEGFSERPLAPIVCRIAVIAETFTKWRPRLVQFCTQRLRDPHEAEEVVQDVFARLVA